MGACVVLPLLAPPCGATTSDALFVQIFRFLLQERIAHWRFQSASNSFSLVGTLAAGCRAGSFGEHRSAFPLQRGVMDLRVALTLAGPTAWNRRRVALIRGSIRFLPQECVARWWF